MCLYVSVCGGGVPDGICARWRRKAGDFCCGGAVYGIGWQCRGGDGGGGVAEWFGERIADLIVTVEAVGLLDCVIISGDHVSRTRHKLQELFFLQEREVELCRAAHFDPQVYQ